MPKPGKTAKTGLASATEASNGSADSKSVAKAHTLLDISLRHVAVAMCGKKSKENATRNSGANAGDIWNMKNMQIYGDVQIEGDTMIIYDTMRYIRRYFSGHNQFGHSLQELPPIALTLASPALQIGASAMATLAQELGRRKCLRQRPKMPRKSAHPKLVEL